jgi:CPA1 family monovalent cation:H+ antiporter
MVWGALHGSIPIALVLGLPPVGDVPGPYPRGELTAMVFGVAAFSLIVQALTMDDLLERVGVATRTDAEELYELLLGRARAVDAALEAAERLNTQNDIPSDVYEDFEAEYGRERDDLGGAISALLSNHPELRYEQVLMGERRVLQQEKSAVIDAMREGVITGDVGEQLLEEVDLKLERVRSGTSTVREGEEGYTESWRERAEEFGLDVRLEVPEVGDTPSSEDYDRGDGAEAE